MNPMASQLSRGVLLAALYFAGAAIAVLYLRTPTDVALFWPAAGIGFAAVLRFGSPYVLSVIAGQLLLHLLLAPVPLLFLPFSLASNAIAIWVAARYVRATHPRLRLRTETGWTLLRAGGLLCTTSAGLGSIGLVVAGMVPLHDWPRAFLQWLLADLLGVTALTPTMLLLFGAAQEDLTLASPQSPARLRERVVWLLLMLLLLSGGMAFPERDSFYPLALAALPLALLLWSAARFSPAFTAVATSLVTMLLALVLGLGIGPPGFHRPHSLQDTALLMGSLVVLSVIPILLAASYHERRQAMAALQHRTMVDPLTGLLNRDAFEEQARARLAHSQGPLSLLYIDLDNFKLVNDAASHAAGDEVLRQVARLIQNTFAPNALLAHSGGDEFTVLLEAAAEQASVPARRLLASIEALRVGWQDASLRTTASISLATSLPPHAAFHELLSRVDAACQQAKDLGGNRLLVVAEDDESLRTRNRMMRTALDARDALERRQIELWCQSIVPLTSPPNPRQLHFEVLLRWRDADGTLHPPANLVAAAERFRLGPRLDRHVINATLAWLDQHPDAAARVAHCGLNLGGATLVDEEFGDYLAGRLSRSKLRAEQLCFEITETNVVRDLSLARQFIQRMRTLGCRFALDDFGTGFCSFSYLRDLPVDYLKIDGSFVRDLTTSPLSESVVRAITDIAHLLGMRAVAEQAENEAQLALLRALKVDFAQGYVFQRPLPIAEFFSQSS